MKIAITGGTGFVGRHLARALAGDGHEVVLIARGVDCRDGSIRQLGRAHFFPVGTDNEDKLAEALAGCHAVAHCAGINREKGGQTYQHVHIQGTRHVIGAAQAVGVRKIALLSFLRARPDCGSPYHESKWAAEQIVRASGLDYTVLKAGVIYGRGDHMLDHLSHALCTFPVFALVGIKDRPVRPVAVEDVTRVLTACLVEGRLSRQTVAVTGPEEMPFSDAVRRVARVVGRHPYLLRTPVFFNRFLAACFEQLMAIPLISVAQVRILAEGIAEPSAPCEELPTDLRPRRILDEQQIRQGLPELRPFGLRDLRWFA